MRVLLADDHTLVRAGLRALLGTMDGVEVVGETGDGREAVEMILRLKPDIALLDISMPGLNGLDVALRVGREVPPTRVIILSMHAAEAYVARALQAGVAGYLLKEAAAAELEWALKAVMRGESYLSPSISRQVVEGYLRAAAKEANPLAGLTERQREILQLIAEGSGTKEIAGVLGLSVKTVETHRAQIMDRLGIRDIPGLVRFAIRSGLVSPER